MCPVDADEAFVSVVRKDEVRQSIQMYGGERIARLSISEILSEQNQ